MRMDLNEKIIRLLVKLDPVEFLGICKILDVRAVEEDGEGDKDKTPGRPFEEIWEEVCSKIDKLNRRQKKNLYALVRAAVKGREKEVK